MAQNKTLELSIKIAGKVDKSLTRAINQTNTLMGSLTTTMSKVGTAGMLEAAAGKPGLLSGYQGAGSALKNRIAGSGIGQYFGSVFSSLGNFGSTLGNTKTGGFLSGLLGKAGGCWA